MAFSGVTARGTATEKNSDTTHTLTPTGTISAGKLAVVTFAIDNVSTSDGDTTDVTISDSAGNTWTRRKERTQSSGAAGDGVTIGVWTSVLAAQLTTSDTVTLTVGASTTCKVFELTEVTTGASAVQVASGTNPTTVQSAGWTSGDPTDVTVSGMPSTEKLFVAVVGSESEAQTLTNDSDYGTATEVNTGAGGAFNSNLQLFTSFRIATLTSDTYGADYSSTPPGPNQAGMAWVVILLALEEGSSGLTAVTLTVTPSQPASVLQTALTAVTLTATPTFPQADVAHRLTAATLTITPALPAATLVSGDFPSIRSAVGSTEDPAATSHTVDMPASVSAGDLLLVEFVIASDATITWDNSTFGTWTVTNSFVSATPGNFRVVVATKTATGAEAGGALTVTTSASRVSASQALAISGWDGTAPEMAQTNFASSASPDPSTLTPTWGSDDNLWLVLLGTHNETTVTTPPSGYAGTQVSSATGAMSAYAWKQATATSDDPGAWSLGSAQGIRATTLAVRGGAVADQTVTAVTLSATPSLPQAAVTAERTASAVTLVVTPTQPQATLRHELTAATLTIVPTQPAGTLATDMLAVTLAVTPTFPQADAGHFLTAATLTEPPTFPQADVSLDTQTVTAVTLTVSVTQPAATLATALAAQTLTVTPAQPQATVTAERTATAVTLEVTPSLPQASISARVSAIPLTVSPTQPAASVDHSITAVTLTASATTLAATVTTENDMAAVTLVVTPTLPQASAQVASLSAQTLTEAPSLPQASISYSLSAVTLTASPTLPQASVNHQILAATLTVTPSLQTATLTTENDLAAVTLVVTPTLPQASAQVGTLHAVTLTNTPTLPQAALVVDQLVTAAPVTVTPTQPQATLSQQVSAVPLTASPTLPQATLRGALVAQPLTATPSLPQATLRTDVAANTINITPVIPAAFVTEPVGAVTLNAAPSIPVATLHHALTGQTLEANPTLPPATMIVGIPGRPARGPTGASGIRPNRALVSASANTISTYGPNDAEVT